MKLIIYTISLVVAVFVALASINQASGEPHEGHALKKKQYGQHPLAITTCPGVVKGVQFYRSRTWQIQAFLHLRHIRSANHERWTHSCQYVHWMVSLWRHRAQAMLQKYQTPPHKSQWLCIHGYEGSWTDPSSPYYGGLQMDLEFQATYGRDLLRSKGTADHWTPLEQMWVAERAFKTRGFWPWPNTARYCGLI